MAVRNKGRSPKQKIRDADRRREALLLRRQGLTYDAIAEKMGYAHRSAAQALVTRALGDLVEEPARDVLKLELERLDVMFEGLVRKPSGSVKRPKGGAFDGDPRAVIAVLKILDRRAKYLGLDAPEKTEVSGPNGGPIITQDAKEALLARLNSLADRLAPRGAEAPGGGGPEPGGGAGTPQ